MKGIRTLNARLNEIEAACEREYFAMDEYANCSTPVWDCYCQDKREALEMTTDTDEMREIINSTNVDDFVDWVRANVVPEDEECEGEEYGMFMEDWWKHLGCYDRSDASGFFYDEDDADFLQITDDWWESLSCDERAEVYNEYFSEC